MGSEEFRFKPLPVTFVIVLFLIVGEAEVMVTPVLYGMSTYSRSVVLSIVPSWKFRPFHVPLVPLRVKVMWFAAVPCATSAPRLVPLPIVKPLLEANLTVTPGSRVSVAGPVVSL